MPTKEDELRSRTHYFLMELLAVGEVIEPPTPKPRFKYSRLGTWYPGHMCAAPTSSGQVVIVLWQITETEERDPSVVVRAPPTEDGYDDR